MSDGGGAGRRVPPEEQLGRLQLLDYVIAEVTAFPVDLANPDGPDPLADDLLAIRRKELARQQADEPEDEDPEWIGELIRAVVDIGLMEFAAEEI